MTGSAGQRRVSSSFFDRYRIPSFSRHDQFRIANILDALDDQIRETEHIIAKIKIVKTGLLSDLLTRGVDEQGQLRPTCQQAPQMYKDSSLGAVPIQWEVTQLARSLKDMPTNGVYKPPSSIGRGALLVGQTAFTRAREIDYRFARRAVMTRDDMDRYGLVSGDILVSRVFATLEGVGQPALVEELPEPAVFESNMMRLRIDKAAAIPEFVLYLLQTDQARRHVVKMANLSNQASINQAAITSLPTALPPKTEQARICSYIQAIEKRRRTEAEVLRAWRLLKHGLMADLLTGHVRVPEGVIS